MRKNIDVKIKELMGLCVSIQSQSRHSASISYEMGLVKVYMLYRPKSLEEDRCGFMDKIDTKKSDAIMRLDMAIEKAWELLSGVSGKVE